MPIIPTFTWKISSRIEQTESEYIQDDAVGEYVQWNYLTVIFDCTRTSVLVAVRTYVVLKVAKTHIEPFQISSPSRGQKSCLREDEHIYLQSRAPSPPVTT